MNEMNSPTLADYLKEEIRRIVPSAINRETNKIDLARLTEALSEEDLIDKNKSLEYYHLNFLGKEKAKNELKQSISNRVFKPLKDTSLNFDASQNLIITADNEEALTLLNKSLYGAVKCIYIDPPYNTGNDFIYDDNFSSSNKEHDTQVGLLDEEGNKTDSTSLGNSHKHSNWLSFMYKRLVLARNLLKEDGVIFISIDDNEQSNLKLLCDEIFGSENFVGEVIRKTKSTTNDAKSGFNIQHENCLIYAKNKYIIVFIGEEKTFENYKNPDNDPKGDWISDNPSSTYTPKDYYEIINPYTGKIDLPPKGYAWRFSKVRLEEYITEGKIVFKKEHRENERGFIFKRYKNEVRSDNHLVSSLDFAQNDYMNQVATKETIDLFGEKYFDFPKPTAFIKKLIQYTTSSANNDIILDFFAGSGTTGQAVMELNKQDGGNRKFILVQIDEPIDIKSEAYKNGFKTIDEITIERVKRVAKKLQTEEDNSLNLAENKTDLGFKHFKIEDSTVSKMLNAYDVKSFKDGMADLESSLIEYQAIDILYEVIFVLKKPLFIKTQEKLIGNQLFYELLDEDYSLCYCQNDPINTTTLEQILQLHETQPINNIVIIDKAWQNDNDKLNFYYNCKELNINFKSI